MSVQFSGIITPLTTPLSSSGDIDGDSLIKLIEWQIENGIHGIFVLGTNGEGNLLMDEQKREVVKIASDYIQGRVPLVCGISDVSLPRALKNIHAIESYEFDAYVSTIPYYCVTSPTEQYEFLKSLCDSADRSVIAYNIPSFVKNDIAVDVIDKIALHERFAGVKESGDDLVRYRKLMSIKKANPGLNLFTGCSHLLDVACALGFDGGVVGLANVAPLLCSTWYTLYKRGDDEGVKAVQAGILRILDKLAEYRSARGHSTTLPANKAILKSLGIIQDPAMVAPYVPASPDDKGDIEKICELITVEESAAERLVSRSYNQIDYSKETAD